MKKIPIDTGEHVPLYNQKNTIMDLVSQSFKKIAPFWPLKNLIAVNPLQGLEDLPIEDALILGSAYFQQDNLPRQMEGVNRITIKWLQVYFDDGQATISIPFKNEGLYSAWRRLVIYDEQLHANNEQHKYLLSTLPETPEQAIVECLLHFKIVQEEAEQFLTLMLTTLPGWAAHIKYRTEWVNEFNSVNSNPVTQADYMAIRLIITRLLWQEAKELLDWHNCALEKPHRNYFDKIQKTEADYSFPLIKKLSTQAIKKSHIPEAQFIFCIDVRSEPFRRALESTGDYQTFGFAGFFGIPSQITDTVSGDSYSSCPVLLTPKHEVKESPSSVGQCRQIQKGHKRLTSLKRLYQSVKYTFTVPFVLVEILGFLSGLWMGIRSLSPSLASTFKTLVLNTFRTPYDVEPSLENISFNDQCAYAQDALRMISLIDNFAPLVVFCGHGSTTENNPYATALDCGACGGRRGASNARIIAAILNRSEVRLHLAKNGINIPESTHFIAAEHSTTTDEVTLYKVCDNPQTKKIKDDLLKARNITNYIRLQKMQKNVKQSNAMSKVLLRSQDWAQARPEWGLARNSAFIVAPRDITAGLDLNGRCFLHSYDYKEDSAGNYLTTILTAPMVVAQWINMQYLFSTLDNVAYGSGSKVTKNITGKIGIMQGNASDLMTGLPLQSVYSSDTKPYHELQRLMTVVFAPRYMLDKIINNQQVLKKLFGNGWVQIVAIEPESRKSYLLKRDFSWQEID